MRIDLATDEHRCTQIKKRIFIRVHLCLSVVRLLRLSSVLSVVNTE